MTIRKKLILYTCISILLTLITVGFLIDRIITNLYESNTQSELNQAYLHFQNNLNLIENDILNQTIAIATEQSVLSVTNLVNRYQDKKNYQPLIFNNEKKVVATHLLKQISLTDSNLATLYSKDGSLLAYAFNYKDKNKNEIGIISYDKGVPVCIKKTAHTNKWFIGKLPEKSLLNKHPLEKQISFLAYSGQINYVSKQNSINIENTRVITRAHPNGKISSLGIIKISKVLDQNFFNSSSSTPNIAISLLLHNGHILNNHNQLLPIVNISTKSKLYGDLSPPLEKIIENKHYYIQSYVWPTYIGKNYLILSKSKQQLIIAIKNTRKILFITFSITAILAIFIGIYWLGRLISTPLNNLAIQAKESDINHYPVFPVSKSNDEISILATVLNKMVTVSKVREKELLENEAQLQSTQKLAKIGGWKIDHVTKSLKLSDEAYRIFEFDPQSHITENDISEMIHPDDFDKVQKAHQKSNQSQTPYELIHRIQTKDKNIKTVRVYSETEFDSSGKPKSTIGTIQDISEQVYKDEQLRRTQKMNSLGKLTGGIAHDFNNMLGIILGYSEILEKNSGLDDKSKKYIEEITQAGKRASNLTSKLLAFSRKDTVTASKTDVNKLLQDELNMLEKTLTVRIQLKLELEADLWPIWLDKNELEDAILNMSINSMHAMPSGGKLILATNNTKLSEIDTRQMSIPAGDYVRLTIMDTGVGMDQSTLNQIFEPFFTTKKDKGTGLGMSQVYGFVQRSQGAIQVYSEINHGTRITLYFPRYIENQLEIEDELGNNNSIPDYTGTATILVVDDEAALRALSQEILSANGYQVLVAESGNKALEILETESVNLMLSDVIMPEMDGYTLARHVKKKYPEIIIQMLSGFTDVDEIDSETHELHKQRLHKPFTAITLLQRVKELLQET